ncbi:MAG: tetratricopeptide repeat protein [Deltaproteobacteria bacterium]|nr:tetratricopeptide repeat protein [Deltaproteobacteria bacterium]
MIFGCAFLLRLSYLFQIDSIPLFYHLAGDGRTYDEWGQRIAAGDWLGKGVFYQAPLYPYFLGILQAILGHNLWLIRLLQITLGAISCAWVFLVGRKLFSREAGIASGLILACYAPAIFFDALIEKTILDLFLISLLLLLLARAIQRQNSLLWLAIGATLGLLGLSRENALILVLVVGLWIGLYFSGHSMATRLRWVGLFFAGVLFVLVPVGVRNLVVGGEFKLTTSQFGPNFFIGNNPAADGTYDSVRNTIGEPQLEGPDAARLAQRATGRDLTPGEVSDYWFHRSLDYIRSQPGHWIQLLGKKWLMLWNAREIEDSDDFYIYQRWSWLLRLLAWVNHFGILAPLAAVGLWLSRKKWRQLWLLYAMTLSLAVSVTIFYIFGRYRFPLVPLLTLFAGAGLVGLAGLYRQRAWRPLAVAAGVLLAGSILVNWPIYDFRGPWPGGYNNLSNAYYKQGRVKEAVENALKAVELQPDFGVAHYNLGNLYAAQGKFGLAKQHFEEAVRLLPNYAEVKSNLGQLLAEQGDLEGGIAQFRKSIELNPRVTRAYLNLGVALAKQGKLTDAVEPLRQVIQLAPYHPEARFYLGSVYAALGQYAEAASSFRDVLRVQSDNAAAHQRLAEVLSSQGKKEEAYQHYQEAVRLMRAQSDSRGVR